MPDVRDPGSHVRCERLKEEAVASRHSLSWWMGIRGEESRRVLTLYECHDLSTLVSSHLGRWVP